MTSGHGKLTYNNGDTYEGEVVNDLRHGKGKHVCSTGDAYDGSWRFDKRDGKGSMVFASGLRYEGQWKDDLAHGHGVCFYPDGQRYEGEWERDQRWGWGKLEINPEKSVESYEGEWSNNVMDGRGRYTFSDGSYFEGDYSEGQRTKGKFVSSDTRLEYVGGWKDNKMHGFGTFVEDGVQKYFGEWKEDRRHGRGKCEYADGIEYDGEWKDDKWHGEGKWKSGEEKYDGHFNANKREGSGSCHFEDGSQYHGNWRSNVRHGSGKCLYGSGDLYEGTWKDDKREGKGSCKYQNGDRYQGEWKDDKREGYGVCVFKDGTKYRGEWVDDKWIQSSADPEFTKVFGPGLTEGIAGTKANFSIEAYDDDENKRLCGGDQFSCSFEGPSSVVVDVVDNRDGTYVIEYTANVAGQYTMDITIGDDELVGHSPYSVRISPGKACPKNCTVSGTGLSLAEVGVPTEFFVETRDTYNNPCTGLPDMPLNVDITSTSGPSGTCTIDACDGGKYRCTFVPEKSDFYRIEISSGSSVVGSSPYSLQASSSSHEEVEQSTTKEEEPVEDVISKWERIAQTEYAADGNADGWDSDVEEEKETAEEKYIREHPGVAVVDNLEDMWRVGRYQQEKKELERKEKAKRLQQLREKLEQMYSKAEEAQNKK